MTPEQYEKFKESLKETQQRSRLMIERMDKTIAGVKDTIEQIQENQRNIDNFRERFGNVMNQLAIKLAGSLNSQPFKKIEGQHYDLLPIKKPAKEVVKALMLHKDIVIMTGAGVSAPSGIPTFRGINGLYSKKFQWQGQEYEPEVFITKAFFDKHPQAIWNWIEEIYKMSTSLKPNKIHFLIDTFAKALAARGKKITLVTQNVDDFHLKPDKQQYQYEACHGNVKFIRCENEHLHKYEDYRKEIINERKEVKCPKCEKPLRPHVLFFDQSYGTLYGGEARSKDFSFAFVIGSSLSTGLCTNLTLRAKEVVEINPSPVIEVGKVFQFTESTEKVLQSFLKELGQKK